MRSPLFPARPTKQFALAIPSYSKHPVWKFLMGANRQTSSTYEPNRGTTVTLILPMENIISVIQVHSCRWVLRPCEHCLVLRPCSAGDSQNCTHGCDYTSSVPAIRPRQMPRCESCLSPAN